MADKTLIFDIIGKDNASKAFDSAAASSAKAHKKIADFGKMAGLGLVAAGVAAVKMAGDFQEGMTTLVTGAGESEGNIKKVANGILAMSVTTATSTKSLTDGMYMIESAGFHGAAGLNVLKVAAEGARVGNASLGSVANAVTSALNAYHLPASKAAEVTNTLIATVANGKMHMDDLAAALGGVIPIASTAHISLAEVGAAMATMTMQGVDASTAATYLRQTIGKLEAPTAAQAKEMESLGLNAVSLSQHLGERGLAGTLKLMTDAIVTKMGPSGLVMIEHLKQLAKHTTNFQKALLQLPPSQQTYVGALSAMVGGVKTLQGALLLSGGNMADFKKNTNAITGAVKAGGTQIVGWSKVQKDFNFQMTQLSEMVKVLAIKIGTVLIPVIQSVIQFFKDHTDVAIALAAVIGTVLVATMALWVRELVTASIANVKAFGEMIAAGATWVAEQIAGFYAVAAAMLPQFIAMGAAALAWGAEMLAAGAMALLPFLPIIAICVVVAAAAYELYKHWDTVWKFIKDIIKDAWDWIKTHVNLIIDIVLGPLGFAINFLRDHWTEIWNGIKEVISAAWNDVLKPTIQFIVDAFLNMAGMIVHAAADAFGWIPGIGGPLKDAAKEFDKFRDSVNASLDGIDKTVAIQLTTTQVTINGVSGGGGAVRVDNLPGRPAAAARSQGILLHPSSAAAIGQAVADALNSSSASSRQYARLGQSI